MIVDFEKLLILLKILRQKIGVDWATKMFHLQRFFSMEQAPPQPDDGGDESFSGVGGETDSTSAEG